MGTEKSIAELWDRFQKLGNYIETEKILKSWGTKGSDGLSHDGRNHSNDEQEIQSLRQQLLDRISDAIRDDCAIGSVARIRFVEEDDMDYIERQMVEVETGNVWAAEAPKLRELGCAILFMAWELEQMKGRQNGN